MTGEQIVLIGLSVEALSALVLFAVDAKMICEMFREPVKHGGIVKFNSRRRAWFDENCKGDETNDNR
jgi:hypothetical protein